MNLYRTLPLIAFGVAGPACHATARVAAGCGEGLALNSRTYVLSLRPRVPSTCRTATSHSVHPPRMRADSQ